MSKLNSITIRCYRSLKDATLELRPLNVMIGANGSGKSNFVSFFKMLNELMASRLQQYAASTGRAASNLHFGPKVTPQLEATLAFETYSGDIDTYYIRLAHAAGDRLIFTEECLSIHKPGFPNAKDEQLRSGHGETLIETGAESYGIIVKTAQVVRHLLNNCRVFNSTTRARRPEFAISDT